MTQVVLYYMKKNRKNTIQFFSLCLIIIALGFVIMHQYYFPKSAIGQIDTNYSVFVDKEVAALKQYFGETNLLLSKILLKEDPNEITKMLTEIKTMYPLIENVHIIDVNDNIYYDQRKANGIVTDETNWAENADVDGYITAPYLDPISNMDILTIAYKVQPQDGQMVFIGYDIKMISLIEYIEGLTKENFYIGYNDNQRVYSINGLQNDIINSEITKYRSYSILNSKYVLYIIENNQRTIVIGVLNRLPVIIVVVLMAILFTLYLQMRFFAEVNRFFENIKDKSYKTGFKDLEKLKATYEAAQVKVASMEEEKSKLTQILKIENQKLNESKISLEKYKSAYEVLEVQLSKTDSNIENIANASSSYIWIADVHDNITFTNNKFKTHFMGELYMPKKLSELLLDVSESSRLLKNRDFQKIKLKFNGPSNSEILISQTKRIFFGNELRKIIFATSTSNYDAKMQSNYLRKSRDLHFINEITKIINNNVSMEQTLQEVIDKVAFLGNFNSCTIRLANEDGILSCVAVSGYSLEYVYENDVPIEGHHMGKAYLDNKLLLVHTPQDIVFKNEEKVMTILNQGRCVAYMPLANYDRSFGVMTIISDFPFNSDILIMLESIAINVTMSLEKLVLYDQLKANYFKTVEAFVNAAEIKSDRFMGHSRRVAELCNLIAERLYFSKSESEEVFISGLLHDVGKLAFQDDVIEEDHEIEAHGEIGMHMIENVGLSKEILNGIAYHHMDYDHSNLESSTISEQPYYAQIIRLSNDYDVYLYKSDLPFDYTRFFLEKKDEIGTFYSPQIFNALHEIIQTTPKRLRSIYEKHEFS